MELLKITLIGLFFGTFGTTIGGIIGIKIKKGSNRFLSFILSLASGLMMAVVCFDLIPEALELGKTIQIVIGIILGVFMMIFCDAIVKNKFNNTKNNNDKNSLLKTGIIVSIGLAIHNFPDGCRKLVM